MTCAELRVLHLVSREARSFEELVDLAWGIYPNELEDMLARLRKLGRIRKTRAGRWVSVALPEGNRSDHARKGVESRTPQQVAELMDGFLERLPDPHPHDFDWRFSLRGVQSFAEHLIGYHEASESMCVVAAPTLYVYLRATGYFTDLSLVERSQDTVGAIREFFSDSAGVYTHDLQYPWPAHLEGGFSCIAMDPPWYQDYYELFLSRGGELIAEGGFVHTALLPPFTRETALSERAAIISFAQHHGLSLVELHRGALEYMSPHFESRSLSATGQRVPLTWRKGDIATFLATQRYARERISAVESGTWREYRIGTSKLKLRVDGPRAYELPSLQPVESESPTLRSVSRRHPGRDKIGLWTSWQQAYVVKGAHVVHTLLEHALGGKTLSQAVRFLAEEFGINERNIRRQCSACYNQVRDIISWETAYAGSRTCRGYHEPAGRGSTPDGQNPSGGG